MMRENEVYRRRRDVRYRLVGGEAVVLRQDKAEVLALSVVGGRIFDLLDGERSVGDICKLLEAEYDAEAEVIRAEVTSFLDDLLVADVIARVASASAVAEPTV